MNNNNFSDEQLLGEFEAAAKQLRDNPDLLKELEPPDGEFEIIMERIRQIKESEQKKKTIKGYIQDKLKRIKRKI